MTYDTLSHMSDPAIWLALASLTVAAGAVTAFALAWVRLRCERKLAARQSDAEGEG